MTTFWSCPSRYISAALSIAALAAAKSSVKLNGVAERLLPLRIAAPAATPLPDWPVVAIALWLWARATNHFLNSRTNLFDGSARARFRLPRIKWHASHLAVPCHGRRQSQAWSLRPPIRRD